MEYWALAVGITDKLRQYLQAQLGEYDLQIETIATIHEAGCKLSKKAFHLLIVDLNYLRSIGQTGWLGRVRRTSYLPVVVLSRDPEQDVNEVVEYGADLCIASEQSFSVIADLVYAQFRRYIAYNHYKTPVSMAVAAFQIGDIYVDPARRTVDVHGKLVNLRPREFSLLLYFMRNPNIVLTAEQICENAWGIEGGYERDVSRPIYALRRAIEFDPQNPVYIQTVYRVGYRFAVKEQRTGKLASN